ncbi:MAG: hypothetical protein JW956_06625 [Calditrichaceae bacterium]|nr:hypothetical protein [Calditrichaceae bacterium]
MSLYTYKFRYIFFLLYLLGFIFPNLTYSQSNGDADKYQADSDNIIGQIVFTANINGVIENCKCGKPPLGGLPQISTLINKIISENEYTYFIDGGDFLNTYPYPSLNSAIVDIYKLLNIEFITLGDQEWIDDDEIDNLIMNEFKSKIIASNYWIDNIDLMHSGTIDLGMGSKAYCISYLDARSFFVSDDKSGIRFDDKLFTSTYNDMTKNDGLFILLYHGTRYVLNALIEKYPKLHLVLWAHEQSTLENISDNPAIIGGGSDGEYIKQIKIYKADHGFKFKVNSIPVIIDIAEDANIRSIIDKFKAADEMAKDQD